MPDRGETCSWQTHAVHNAKGIISVLTETLVNQIPLSSRKKSADPSLEKSKCFFKKQYSFSVHLGNNSVCHTVLIFTKEYVTGYSSNKWKIWPLF